MSLYENINKRRKAGKSRPKSKSTISPKAYKNMKAGFPKKKEMKRKLIQVAKGLDKASKSHAKQSKVLKKIIKNTKK